MTPLGHSVFMTADVN